jgi:hypothetical protein
MPDPAVSVSPGLNLVVASVAKEPKFRLQSTKRVEKYLMGRENLGQHFWLI